MLKWSYLHMLIRKFKFGFAIVAVDVDDTNLIRTPNELLKTAEFFKKKNLK